MKNLRKNPTNPEIVLTMSTLMDKFEFFFSAISFSETESLEDGSEENALWMGRCAGFMSNFVE